jgi:uncharacterized protein (DUF3820 family)
MGDFVTLATLSGCWDILIALSTTLFGKPYKGPRLIAVPNGKNDRDWIIRSRVPKAVMTRLWYLFRERQEVGLSELVTRYEGLRYVPALGENLEVNRQQSNL